jgi:N-glycosidase YbiA
VIGPFRGEYDFLSNFYLRAFLLGNVWFGSVEHWYQAGKMCTLEDFNLVVAAPTAREAKRIARSKPLHPGFEAVKRAHMLTGVTAKFLQHEDLRARLVATGDEQLMEVNTWGDKYWGVSPDMGLDGDNWLGRILMMVREVLQ